MTIYMYTLIFFEQLVNLVNLEPSMLIIKLILAVTRIVPAFRMGTFATMELLLDHWLPICVMMAMCYRGVISVRVGLMDSGVNICRHVKKVCVSNS
jgi:hypothetical protein